MSFAAISHQFRRELDAAQEKAEAAITLSTEQGIALWAAWGTPMKGWVLTKQGQAEAGIDLLRKGLAAWQATGVEVFSAYFLTLLAEAYRKVEQTESGLNVLAEAQAVVEKTGERVWEAEIHQLKGELLLVLGRDEAEADACFHKTLEVARRQQVKSGELRETMSLSRL